MYIIHTNHHINAIDTYTKVYKSAHKQVVNASHAMSKERSNRKPKRERELKGFSGRLH